MQSTGVDDAKQQKACCYVMFLLSLHQRFCRSIVAKIFSLTIRFGYFRFRFIFVSSCIFVSIIVFVNDYDVFSLTIIFVFVNEINTVLYAHIMH